MSTIDRTVATDGAPEAAQEASPSYGGVRWKRFGGMLAATGAMAVGMVFLTAQGVLAANFSISGMPFTVTAQELNGEGFEQFARLREGIKVDRNGDPSPKGEAEQKLMIVSAIRHATMTKLCQSVHLGGGYMKITAGGGKDPVDATALVVDSDLIQGHTTFNGIDIGQDASTLDKVDGVKGHPFTFGQQADTVKIKDLRQNNYATTAATFTLPNLRMTFDNVGC
jgi:hypothetical protein